MFDQISKSQTNQNKCLRFGVGGSGKKGKG